MSMNKRACACLILLAVVVSILAGCDSNVETIRLKGNATKGYSWDYESVGDNVVEEVERRYADGNVLGTVDAPGVYLFKFKGTDEGEARLVFRYVAEDDEAGEYMSTIIYRLKVDDSGRIIECRPVGVMASEIEEEQT